MSARGGWLLLSTLVSGLAYCFTRWGPWGQANSAGAWIGPQNSAELGDACLVAIGAGVWVYILTLSNHHNFSGSEDRITRATIWALTLWTLAFFSGRFSPFSYAINYTLSSGVQPGQPNATIAICSYVAINYASADCMNLIGATVVLAYLWLCVIWYWTRGSGLWMFMCCRSPNAYPMQWSNMWKTWGYQTAWWLPEPGGFRSDDPVADNNYVNQWRYAAFVQLLWLIALATATGQPWAAVNQPGTYLQAQVDYGDASLVTFLFASLFWIISVFIGTYETWYAPKYGRRVVAGLGDATDEMRKIADGVFLPGA